MFTQGKHLLKNEVIENTIELEGKTYNGFYIDYNDEDIEFFGSVTTGLILGQLDLLLISNGDHTKQYEKIINQGFDACLAYFKSNPEHVNKHSDKISF